MKLYEIQDQIDNIINQAIDSDGQIIDETLLDQVNDLAIEKEEKCLNIAYVYKNTRAEIDAVKAEIQRFNRMKSTLDNKMTWLKNYLGQSMATDEKYKNIKASIGWQKSTSVNVENVDILPDEFKRVTSEPNKPEIKNALKNNQDVIGCTLVEKINLVIK